MASGEITQNISISIIFTWYSITEDMSSIQLRKQQFEKAETSQSSSL